MSKSRISLGQAPHLFCILPGQSRGCCGMLCLGYTQAVSPGEDFWAEHWDAFSWVGFYLFEPKILFSDKANLLLGFPGSALTHIMQGSSHPLGCRVTHGAAFLVFCQCGEFLRLLASRVTCVSNPAVTSHKATSCSAVSLSCVRAAGTGVGQHKGALILAQHSREAPGKR